MFQKLDKLLGAYIPAEEPGVLITTQRPLPVQRFTGAHELGHLYMRHEPSLDDESILRRAPFSTTSPAQRQEREADAFASMFLAPSWLLALIVQRQKWPAKMLADPATVYQASLRFGTSYTATCYVLERHKVINRTQRERLLSCEPKTIKQSLLHGYEPPDWRSDVWLLTDRDEGALIEGGRNDVFVVRLHENSGAGYLWSFDELKAAGFALVTDDQEADRECVGGILTRRVTARSSQRTQGEVTGSRICDGRYRLHSEHRRRQGFASELWSGARSRSSPTCMAFAASDAHAGARAGWQPLSTEWAYYYALKRDGSVPHEGATMSGMLDAIRLDGQPEEAAWPYIAEMFTDMAVWVPPKANPVFRRESAPRAATIEEMIDCLEADDPVLFTMSVSTSFFKPGPGGVIDAAEPLEPKRVHALIAVGHGHRQQEIFVIVRNSWGEPWGVEGYAWLATSYLKPRLLRAATMAGEL
jgi:Zn-dependent peptidase ImmA (M78 family)